MSDSNVCLLKTVGIGKEFSSVPVLKDINIEIFRGEILGIIGENGAGKSTLMKIFSGIYTPTSGEILRELEVEIKPDEKIENLRTAQKQMVEICKAVALDAKLLIMDEPTTVLTRYEIEILFTLMRRLQRQGTTIIYISHKLREVRAICDRVVVLRDGEVVLTE